MGSASFRDMPCRGMAQKQSPRSAGIFIAVGVLIGVIYGSIKGQPSIGLIAGLIGGCVITAIVWLIDRKRTG